MRKIVLLAYNGELTCFAHVMLYALDFQAKRYTVRLIIEGAATGLIGRLDEKGAPFADHYRQLKEGGLITCICQACSQKMGTLEEARRQGLTIAGELSGHPGIEAFVRDGFEILSF